MSIFAIVLLCALAALSFLPLWREGLLSEKKHLLVAAFMITAAFAVRAMYMSYETLDYQNFLSHWVEFFRQNGGFKALNQPIGNYNLPYLYFLAAFSYFKTYDLYLIKLLSIAFDVLLAYAAMKLVGHFTKSKSRRLFAYLITLLLPTVVINGAVWGQCDSIYVALGLMSVYYALSKRPVLSMVFIALSFAFKLQAVFIMPVFLILLYTNRVKIWHFLVFPLTYFVVVLPAIIAGRPILDTVTLYFNQTGSIGDGLNYNSPSVFAIISRDADKALYSKLGIAAAFLFLLIIFVWLFIYRKRLTDMAIFSAAVLIVVGVPFFLPHMHDRYFFAADIFTFVMAMIVPRYFPLPLLASFASLLGYHAYLKMQYFLPMSFGAFALVFVMLIVIYDLAMRIYGPGASKGK